MATEHNDIAEQLDALDLQPEQKANLARKLHEMRSYVPKVGVFGKTGVGKSSLCNALFGQDICEISDVEACTREPQEVLLSIGSSGLRLLDVPGVGESHERDQEYDELYQSLLPELDLIFWVFKADDRAAASDEHFYKRLIQRYVEAGKPFLAVLNQVDKVEPFREWDMEERKPSPRQLGNIETKRISVASLLGIPMSRVIAVSADE
ncbi:GTP-binding protein, partial [Salmonella enterica subsp. enterica]|nr:GTP-binding protein [Salmonella enterica subsp. enterica serovar Javiana]